MNTLDSIRDIGTRVAYENGIFDQPKLEEVTLPNDLIEDFIKRVETDLFEFATLEQFADYFNLFHRAFMYIYGKGAAFCYFTRIGIIIDRLSYDFDEAMQGICGGHLPVHIRFRVNQKASAILEMYIQMFEHTRAAQDKIIAEGLNFENCIHTMLNGAFFYGTYICMTLPISESDHTRYSEPLDDKPYDYDTYDNNYQPEDYRIVKIK